MQSDTHELNSSIYWGGMRYWNPLNDFYNSTQKNSSTTEQQWARVDLTMNRVVTYVGSWGEREKRQRLVEQTIGWNMPDWCERLTFKERLKLRNREITIIIRRWSKASLDRGPHDIRSSPRSTSLEKVADECNWVLGLSHFSAELTGRVTEINLETIFKLKFRPAKTINAQQTTTYGQTYYACLSRIIF